MSQKHKKTPFAGTPAEGAFFCCSSLHLSVDGLLASADKAAGALEPVGNLDDGFFAHQLKNRLHQLPFVFGVDIGHNLVSNDEQRILPHGAGDGEPLLIPRKRAGVLAWHRFIALRQLEEISMLFVRSR